MPMTGDDKKAYQREYMRRKRLGLTGSNKTKKGPFPAPSVNQMVGVRGFEPPTSASQTLRAKPTALHPDYSTPAFFFSSA